VNWIIVAVNVIILCILSVTSSYASKCSYSGVWMDSSACCSYGKRCCQWMGC